MVLVAREILWIAVESTPSCYVDEPTAATVRGSLRSPDRTDNVRSRIHSRIAHRHGDGHLRGAVDNYFTAPPLEQRRQRCVSHVAMLELRGGRTIGTRSGREIVHDEDFVAKSQQAICDVGADETGPARHNDPWLLPRRQSSLHQIRVQSGPWPQPSDAQLVHLDIYRCALPDRRHPRPEAGPVVREFRGDRFVPDFAQRP